MPDRTFNALLDFYFSEYLPAKAPRTQAQQRGFLTRLRPTMGPLPVTALTRAYLRAWRDRLSQRLKPGTVHQYMDVLSAVLTVAVEDLEWIPSHPMRKVRKPPASPKRVRFLTPDEQQRLLAACRASKNPGLYPLVLLALSTGARRGELFSLRWQDVDLVEGSLRLAQTKNKDRRAVPVRGPALEVLRAWRNGHAVSAWVFPRTGQRTAFPGEYSWRAALRVAGIANFCFHDLRHTCASYLAMSGVRIEDIAQILGHRSIQVTMRYRHVAPSYTAALVENMAQKFIEVRSIE